MRSQNANAITNAQDSVVVKTEQGIANLLDENMLPAVDYSEVPRTEERILEVEAERALGSV